MGDLNTPLLFCRAGVVVVKQDARRKEGMPMTKVVQFMHQGGEVDPRKLAMYNGWNATKNHGRRLLRHWGEYVNAQNQIVSDDLAFWNEYEAPTIATQIGGVNHGSINAVSAIWNEVRLQVQKNGFVLGTHFDWTIAVNNNVANTYNH